MRHCLSQNTFAPRWDETAGLVGGIDALQPWTVLPTGATSGSERRKASAADTLVSGRLSRSCQALLRVLLGVLPLVRPHPSWPRRPSP